MRLSIRPSMKWFFAMVAGDGRSHWFKGVQLITLYLVIAMMFYFLPLAH